MKSNFQILNEAGEAVTISLLFAMKQAQIEIMEEVYTRYKHKSNTSKTMRDVINELKEELE